MPDSRRIAATLPPCRSRPGGLNDAAESSGGLTRFFPERGAPRPALTVTPAAGTLIALDHDLWHDGEQVTAGVKYVLRSDIPFRDSAAGGTRGRLWSGSRERTLRLWDADGRSFRCKSVRSGHGGTVQCLARTARTASRW